MLQSWMVVSDVLHTLQLLQSPLLLDVMWAGVNVCRHGLCESSLNSKVRTSMLSL